MIFIFLSMIAINFITYSYGAQYDIPRLQANNSYIINTGPCIGQEVTIVTSANRKWHTNNIWSNLEARKHATVQRFYIDMIKELYPYNCSAQKELILCYKTAHDIKPLLATTKYDSKEYFIIGYQEEKTKEHKQQLIPKEWLSKNDKGEEA